MATKKTKSVATTTDLGVLDMGEPGMCQIVTTELKMPRVQQDTPGVYHRGGAEFAKRATAYATERSACFDLRAYMPTIDTVVKGYAYNNQYFERTVRVGLNDTPAIIVQPGDRVMIPTGMHFRIPSGFQIQVHPRSGTSLKEGMVLANQTGVIDGDYVDEVFVLIHNTSGVRMTIEHDQRIAQAEMKQAVVATFDVLDAPPQKVTSRAGGFGHTGKN